MAIGFAKFEFIKRSDGKNVCAKAAYNSRSEIQFEGSQLQKPKEYSWSWKETVAYHEILLPSHVDSKFKNPTVLWNEVEKWETKRNAQVAIEVLLALPDDAIVSVEDKINLAVDFVKKNFVEKGLAAQIDVHPPERSIIFSEASKTWKVEKGDRGVVLYEKKGALIVALENGKTVTISKDFQGYIEKEHNWHAHVLLTTRRFKENGLEFEDHKARDLMPTMATRKYEKNGFTYSFQKVTSAQDWGQLWAEHQNQFFLDRGINLSVEPKGVVSQIHLGPFRMRGRAFSLLEENHERLEENHHYSKNPEKILEALTEKKSVFTREDLGRFLSKHVLGSDVEKVAEEFWKLPQIIQLAHKKTGQFIEKFTSQAVIEEEKKILRLGDRIHSKNSIGAREVEPVGLNEEQRKAYSSVLKEGGVSILQGFAGTGKSYLLYALQQAYQDAGYTIRSFGPDSATIHVLKEKGLSNPENTHQFLFGAHHGKRDIKQGKEFWIIDEAGKLSNGPLLELFKEADKKNIKIILSGDMAQLPPVGRGGMFKVLAERYNATVLKDIQRQKQEEHRVIAKSLATGQLGAAIDRLSVQNGIRWENSKQDAMEELVKHWAVDRVNSPKSSSLMIAHSNKEVRVLNELARLIRVQRGEIAEKEYLCTSSQGKFYVSTGDLIEFRKNDSMLGVTNGLIGTLVGIKENCFAVSVEKDGKKQTVSFSPEEYHSYQLGYASTFYRSQGRTVDKAYVLHSSMINKEMFYVGLTRHVKDVLYFASKDEVSCLAELKAKTAISGRKELSIDYTSALEMSLQKLSAEKESKINSLQSSSNVLDRMKGFGLSTWDHVTGKIGNRIERIQDRTSSKEFYNYKPLVKDGAVFSVSLVENPSELAEQIVSGQKESPDRRRERELYQETKQSNYLCNTDVLQKKPGSAVVVALCKSVHPETIEQITKRGMLCVTFTGENKDVKSQDWAILHGKRVLVWPENTKESLSASNEVCRELRKVGIKELREVQTKDFCPKKWSLDQSLPKEAQTMIYASSMHKGTSLDKLAILLSIGKDDYTSEARANEILWRVDERLRPELEKKLGDKFGEINQKIVDEAYKTIHFSEEKKNSIQKSVGLQGQALDKLMFHVSIFEADKGRNPRLGELQILKNMIQKHGYMSFENSQKPNELVGFALDRTLIKISEKALKNEPVKNVEAIFTKELHLMEKQVQQMQNVAIQEKDMNLQRGMSLER